MTKWRWRRFGHWLRGLWSGLLAWWVLTKHRIANAQHLAQLTDHDAELAREAVRKVVDARLFPPDCVSAGTANGGCAIFFKHDGAKEVFIDRTHSMAADRLLEWWRGEQAAGLAPVTQLSTRMNRHDRRAWKSNRRKNLHKGAR